LNDNDWYWTAIFGLSAGPPFLYGYILESDLIFEYRCASIERDADPLFFAPDDPAGYRHCRRFSSEWTKVLAPLKFIE